ncbi:short-chain dehydrogenase [Plectosphaerella plurivora]|uniref:Short-chain dehydrogenase n=1 Tax=Plectosphaerella plurivora TaxID=936078 RepID=A0A9P9AAW2_9PEZI|nr:short-chain dehydrogenase [Plectosphaerella plurivora]
MASNYAQAHEFPAGPGDARPTASQIIKDEGLEGKWQDKVILITGGSAGIGLETARALAATGANLYLTGRDLDVRAFAADFTSKTSKLNILIENAGTQYGTNHLAHFLLFQLLKSTLLASSTPDFNSRVAILSSMGHRAAEVNFDNLTFKGEYNPWVAYGQSKTANVWTAGQIDRLYGSKGIHAWSIHPGVVFTGLYKHATEDDIAATQGDTEFVKIIKTPEQGAATAVWAVTAKTLEGQGGKYLENCQISKQNDPSGWQWALGHAAWARRLGLRPGKAGEAVG